jgi:hypothetical protein
MKVYLLPDDQFAIEEYNELIEFLRSFSGPISFIASEEVRSNFHRETQVVDPSTFYEQVVFEHSICAEPLPYERSIATWQTLFDECESFRDAYEISPGHMVVLLTPCANENNWFSASDPMFPNNGFAHTGEWAHYVKCPSTFPVAYLLASLILQCKMFSNMETLNRSVHYTTMGCFNDFCQDKKDIILKLRTADICNDCTTLLQDKVPMLVINQVLDIFEGVRKRILFVQNFRKNANPSKLLVKNLRKFYLVDYGNLQIKLNPLESTLYNFFLHHPEGVQLNQLCDHREELKGIYSQLATTGMLSDVHHRIIDLTNPLSNSASEKISKIKNKFEKLLGEQLARHYYIQGENGTQKYIPLPRDLVQIER